MSLNYVYVFYFTLTACFRPLIGTFPQEALRRYGQPFLQRWMRSEEMDDLSCNDGFPGERWMTFPATMDALGRDGRSLLPE